MTAHERLQGQIPAYIAGQLDPKESLSIEQHVRGCEECSEVESIGRDVVRGLREEGLDSSHPASEMLREYSAGQGADGQGWLSDHVASCIPCEVEVDAWQRFEQGASGVAPQGARVGDQPRQRGAWGWASGLAAGIAVGIALTLIFLRGVGPDREQAQRTEPWNGTAAFLGLENPTRGSQPVPSASLEPGQPYLPLAVAFSLPASSDEARVRFKVVREGSAIWELDLLAGRVRALGQPTGLVTFLIPSGDLESGRFSFQAFAVSESTERLLLEVPFDLQRQSPAATNAPQ